MVFTTNWTVTVDHKALKSLQKLSKPVKEQMDAFVQKLETLENPRILGKSLQGNLSDYWCYRVGDYRIICEIQDHQLIVLVVGIGHRSDVYRR